MKHIIKNILKEEVKNYMFFQNLKQIKDKAEELLSMDEDALDKTISDGHDWASEHIATAKDDVEEVHAFLTNKDIREEQELYEKKDACYHKVKSRYKVWPSAYASGALVKCRKVGANNWGNKSKKKESEDKLLDEKRKLTSKASSESNLGDWFRRKGGSGPASGWVDCNTCRDGKCKPCGRKEGEKRSKYPACRPTPSACKDKGKGSSWGKKSKKESISEGLIYHLENNIPLTENIYRYGSEGFFSLINEVRDLYHRGLLKLNETEKELIDTQIGEKTLFEGEMVWLDTPMEDDQLNESDKYKGTKTNSPSRGGGSKAYKVYVSGCAKKTKSNPRGIKKVTFGSGGLRAKINDPERRKAFDSRHGCSAGRHNDKCKAGYWSCRLPRYAKALGLSGGGTWW